MNKISGKQLPQHNNDLIDLELHDRTDGVETNKFAL